ncbi:MAG: hypothetical protein O3A46_16510 [Candidatus Poribacteria bacterium]|nr:hypothetical protein [Candidatus Poribacteria bacterium]
MRRDGHGYVLVTLMGAWSIGCVDVRQHEAQLDATSVRIASFHIQVFGASKRGNPTVMNTLVTIADEFDILIVQGIRDITGETPTAYLDAMNAVGDERAAMIVSPRLGRTASTEQYAIYYDTNVVTRLRDPATYLDPSRPIRARAVRRPLPNRRRRSRRPQRRTSSPPPPRQRSPHCATWYRGQRRPLRMKTY